jgi:CBS domain-containing protein
MDHPFQWGMMTATFAAEDLSCAIAFKLHGQLGVSNHCTSHSTGVLYSVFEMQLKFCKCTARKISGKQYLSFSCLEGVMDKINVRDYMAKDLIVFRPDEDIYKAIDTLVKAEISGAPVVDDDGKLVGIISQKDCLRILANGVFHNAPAGVVSQYMTEAVMTIDPDTDIFTVVDLFLNTVYRRIPVVENDVVVGQISRRDILRAIQHMTSKS